jgi:magnesium chelatase family protein
MQEVSSKDKSDVSSSAMHNAVIEAFKLQKERGQVHLNGKLSEDEIETYCILASYAMQILEGAIRKFGLSHRSIASVKKIGRTIADLNRNEKIEKRDLLEALSYRRRK